MGRSAAGALQDQELLLQEDILSENGSGSASSQENGQSGQQMHQQYNRVFHGQAACAALDSGAREPDRRCGAPQLRIRHVQAGFTPNFRVTQTGGLPLYYQWSLDTNGPSVTNR
jgi:hypothetical protein